MPETKYVVTFERIGRSRDLPPLEVVVDDSVDAVGDAVAEAVWRFANGRLGSKMFEVDANLETGVVLIEWGRFGKGTVAVAP